MEPTQEDIAQQEAMLATHRRSLAHYLQQQAAFGMHIPAYVATSISEARREIERIKDALRGWGVAVEDHPDDSPPAIPPLPLPSLVSAPQQHPEQSATAGHQTGGINFGVGATIQQMSDVVAGDKIGGDKIAGDQVAGDKNIVGNIEHSNVAIGTGASVITNTYYAADVKPTHHLPNPLHWIIDLLTKYHCTLGRVHQANTNEAWLTALDEWRSCHLDVWGSGSVRNDTIRKLADPAKEWLSQIKCPYVNREDFDLIEEAAFVLSGFAVSPPPMAMPDVYSKAYTTEDELWQRWNEQGDRYMALGGQIAQLKELAARAGQKWDFSLPAN